VSNLSEKFDFKKQISVFKKILDQQNKIDALYPYLKVSKMNG
jgi:hypothetical protein